ncbi:MAG: hypothetical protein ACTSR5_16135, partial [Promethearchaeota archaeon]
VNNKSNPTVINSFSDTGDALSLFVNDSRLYLADGDNGLEVFDITDLGNPIKLSTDLDLNGAQSVTVSGEVILVARDSDGLSFVQNNAGVYTLFDTFYDGGQAESVAVNNSIIFLADGYDNCEIIGIDSDNDNLADISEAFHGTDPFLEDTDFDELNDWSEVTIYDLNPLSNDTDNDSMNDYFEVTFELNPKDSSDTTGDPDIDELVNIRESEFNTNPRNNDTDHDYLLDGEEVDIYHTNPNLADTDNDGWIDGWEIYYGTDPLDPNSYPDSDVTPTGPPPTTLWREALPYYIYLAIFGGLVAIGLIILLIFKLRKPRAV